MGSRAIVVYYRAVLNPDRSTSYHTRQMGQKENSPRKPASSRRPWTRPFSPALVDKEPGRVPAARHVHRSRGYVRRWCRTAPWCAACSWISCSSPQSSACPRLAASKMIGERRCGRPSFCGNAGMACPRITIGCPVGILKVQTDDNARRQPSQANRIARAHRHRLYA